MTDLSAGDGAPEQQLATTTNPFVVESPEKLTPSQIVDLFIDRFTDVETVKQRKHTFVWGSRGSGKSMMLRFLEPTCQMIAYGTWDAFLQQQSQPFLAVYCPCKEGQLNKTELGLLDKAVAGVMSEHMLNLMVADRVLEALLHHFPPGFLAPEDKQRFKENVTRLFDKASIASSVVEADEFSRGGTDAVEWLQRLFGAESRKVSAFLRRAVLAGGAVTYEGTTSGYHDFLLPFMKEVKALPQFRDVSIYVMLDDANRLTGVQQQAVNTWIANRDQATLCIKVSAQREGYTTTETRDGGVIEEPHDYSQVVTDELYTEKKSDYGKKVKLIAERRLRLSDVPTKSMEELLPADAYEERLLAQYRTELEGEWERLTERPARQGDYVHRLLMARLFQHLRRAKQKKSYAGFDNIVHLSSGVVRDFLEPCYLMFDKCIGKGMKPEEITAVAPAIQDEILYPYSEAFLNDVFEHIRQTLPPEKQSQLDRLWTLLNSLGRLFYKRLTDPEVREARLFSFTVRGDVPDDLRQVLNLGVRYRYLQRRTYSTKEGGGREFWYILNRRLCPVFELDPTGFEGRMSLTPDMLRLACEDPDRFVRARLKQLDEGQLSLFVVEESRK